MNSTFDKGPVGRLDSTFAKDSSPANIRQDLDRHHNGTFNTKPTTSASLLHQQHNATFDISNNATFEVIPNHSQDIGKGYYETIRTHNNCQDCLAMPSTSSQTLLLCAKHQETEKLKVRNMENEITLSKDNDDRLFSTSDSSVSHRLNDLGDVKHLESTFEVIRIHSPGK